MSFFKNFKNLFESTEEKQDRLDRERRQRQANKAAEAEGGIEFTIGMDNYDDHTEADAADAERAAERAAEADAADAERAAERAAEAMTAAQANARRRLSERIERWNEQTLENVGDDIKTSISLTPAGRLEKIAYALLDEYNALVAAHEKLFARCYSYTDEKGVTRYVYIYPTEQLWMGRPGNFNLLYKIFDEAYYATKSAQLPGWKETKGKLKQISIGFYDKEDTLPQCSVLQRYYRGPDKLPETAVPCPEHVVSEEQVGTKQGCALQGGSKKSKSKYSRKTKSKYSRKSKSKYLRKSKSKLKSKYSRKY